MHKKAEKNITEIQKKTIDLIQQVSNHRLEEIKKLTIALDETIKTQSFIIDMIRFLYKAVFFLSLILTWVLLLQDTVGENLSTFITWWPKLSEGWQILIVSIPILIIAQVTGNLITEKLQKK